MSEFNLIKQHFTRDTHHTNLSIGDDAALISVNQGMELAISADMLVSGTHFFSDCDPEKLGWKGLAVNISDMAAMGAKPCWATLAISLPHADDAWLGAFSRGFFACARAFNIDLIGGDTTRGPLTIAVQIMGEVPIGKAIKRSGAKIDDDIWVSGTLGDAALALAGMRSQLKLTKNELSELEIALHTPQPRVALGIFLREVATSCIDISDGLVSDLGHILAASQLGANIQLMQLPISKIVSKYFGLESVKNLVLAGGDDYELCFTSPIVKRAEIERMSSTLTLPLTRIGTINQQTKLNVIANDQKMTITHKGYNHFA